MNIKLLILESKTRIYGTKMTNKNIWQNFQNYINKLKTYGLGTPTFLVSEHPLLYSEIKKLKKNGSSININAFQSFVKNGKFINRILLTNEKQYVIQNRNEEHNIWILVVKILS